MFTLCYNLCIPHTNLANYYYIYPNLKYHTILYSYLPLIVLYLSFHLHPCKDILPPTTDEIKKAILKVLSRWFLTLELASL